MSPWSQCLLGRRWSEGTHTLAETQRFQACLIPWSQLEHKKKMGAWYLSGEKSPRFLQEVLFLFLAIVSIRFAHIISKLLNPSWCGNSGDKAGAVWIFTKASTVVQNLYGFRPFKFLSSLLTVFPCSPFKPTSPWSETGNITRKGGSCSGFQQHINN